jgi:hypothetical protein
MVIYTVDMFDIYKIEDLHKDLFMRKETLEFQLRIYQTKFDEFMKLNCKELLIFERKKEQTLLQLMGAPRPKYPNNFVPFNSRCGNNVSKVNTNTGDLLPDNTVMLQMKAIALDPAVKEFKKIIAELKNELVIINSKINGIYNRLNKMFSFTEINLRRYLNSLVQYYSGRLAFDDVMKDIFNIEFNNTGMYFDVKEAKNYDMFKLLIKKIPKSWHSIGFIIYLELLYVILIEDLEKIDSAIALSFIESEKQNRKKRMDIILDKVKTLDSQKLAAEKTKLALDTSLYDNSSKIASEFLLSRKDRHDEIVKAANDSAENNRNFGYTPSVASRMINPNK